MDLMRIHLSLVSHTNIGKTTLARTLLSRDIGEVADRAHVTETTDDYVLARNAEGCELVLWDTPGFGNSVQLAKRLEGRSNPVGWFMSEIWDRVTNKTQWLNQKAFSHVKDVSSVVLYLVNSSEDPSQTPYVDAEMRIMQWIGKPVIVLLNQMGQPRPHESEDKEVSNWKSVMQQYPLVKAVLPMDAFARCWVQEFALFDAIARALPEDQLMSFEALRDVWSRQRRAAYSSSIQALTHYIVRLAKESERVQTLSIKDQLLDFTTRLTRRKDSPASSPDPTAAAQTALSARATEAFCALTDELIKTNMLKGNGVKKEILRRVKTDWNIQKAIQPEQAAVAGAVGAGAVGGIAADIATGGLTLGMGTLIGTILGAMGGAGLAIVYNKKKDLDGTVITWSEPALMNFVTEAVLLYLAIAHFGRGRGNWIEGEHPHFWKELVETIVREEVTESAAMTQRIDAITRRVLASLYPDAQF